MPLFDRVSAQLLSFEQNLESTRKALAHSGNASNRSTTDNSMVAFEQSVRGLRHDISQLNLLYEITSQFNAALTLDEVIKSALELVWQKTPLSFAVVVLGDDELGPFHYQGMKGVSEQWRYLKGECAFPLSGVLSRSLLNRLDPTEPDYLHIRDIEAEGRPLPQEFPWMRLHGSLLVVPLRRNKNAIGALILGHQETHAFIDSVLCEDLCEIAANVARSVHGARLQHEVNKNVEQLVNVQLLTQEIARATTFKDVIKTLTKRVPEVMGLVDVQVFMHHEKGARTQDARPAGRFLQFDAGCRDIYDTPEVSRLLEWSMESGEAVFYDPNAIHDHPEYSYYTDSGAAMIVPMVACDKAIGVIRVQAQDHLLRFDESDMFVLRTIANSVWLALKHVRLIEEQHNKKLADLKMLAATLETRLPLLQGHHTRVAHNAAIVAKRIGLSTEECNAVQTSAALHDIGGLQLSDEVLQGQAAPSQMTREQHQNLALKSSQYLSNIDLDGDIVGIISQMAQPFAHYDYQVDVPAFTPASISGVKTSSIDSLSPIFSESDLPLNGSTGHQIDNRPDQLVSARIASAPKANDGLFDIGARILAVVDALDHALCANLDSDIPNPQIDYLNEHSGTLFAPHVVQALLSLLEQEQILLPSTTK